MPRAEIDRRVRETAAILRIEHLLDSRINGLSGGDRQRVALGRAIVRQPKAFLMDEPLGTLDAEFRELMCVELRKLHDRLKTTTVFVTHDQNEAMALADHIVVMNEGEILQADDPHGIYNFPVLPVRRALHRPPADEPAAGRGAGGARRQRVRLAQRDLAVPRDRRPPAPPWLAGRAARARAAAGRRRRLPGRARRSMSSTSARTGSPRSQTDAGSLKVLADKAARPVLQETRRPGLRHRAHVVLFDAATERLLPSATTAAHLPGMRHG